MLRIDRICVYIIMLGLMFIVPSIQYIMFIDEFCAMLFGCVALLDCIVNRNWRKYKLLWIVMAIMTFYAIYSVTMVHFNISKAIFVDWIISLKPYVPFIVMFAVAPQFTHKDKQIIKWICLFNVIISSITLLGGDSLIELVFFHPMYCGVVTFVCMVLYLYCSIGKNGEISPKTLITALIFLSIGLLCARAKYYGSYVLALYFIFAYRPGMLRYITPMRAFVLLLIGVLVLAVSWHKIEYYFLVGNSDSFDPTVVQSFARPVLYATGFLILFEFIPFGSGLASFASFASAEYYSGVYAYYGIDKVHGLSQNYTDFICDAYYPSLAQYGIIGVLLFIWFWRYSYNYLRLALRQNSNEFRYLFILGSLIICFILIECTSGTILVQSGGMVAMALYGIICAQGKEMVSKRQKIEKGDQENRLTRKI